jgi:ribosomal protein L11 methyltransferase
VTAANARLNGLAGLITTRQSTGFGHREIRRRGPYDLILANVLARPLMRLARPLALSLGPGGIAVLSGLLAAQAAQVMWAQRLHGLRLLTPIEIDGWTTLVIGRSRRRLT